MSTRFSAPGTLDLHVETRGRGDPPLLLVHGFGASGHSWRKWLPALEERHTIHNVDLTGFGSAPTPQEADMGAEAQARRVAELVRSLPGGPPVLVGHSLGGPVVLLAALELLGGDGPPPVAGLVVVSGPAFRQRLPRFIRLARKPLLGRLLLLAPPPRWALRAGIRTIVRRKEAVDQDLVEGYRAPLLGRARRRAILRAARELRPEDADRYQERYREISVPVLLLWGSGDRIVPPWQAERLQELLPRARSVVLPGVGHLPMEEAPERSLGAVLAFLEELALREGETRGRTG